METKATPTVEECRASAPVGLRALSRYFDVLAGIADGREVQEDLSRWADEWEAREVIVKNLLAACKAVASLSDGQGRRNLPEVAGMVRAAIATAEEENSHE